MIRKVQISGMRRDAVMATKKGIRERFAMYQPLTKPLTKRLSGLRSAPTAPLYIKTFPYISIAKLNQDHKDENTIKSKRFA